MKKEVQDKSSKKDKGFKHVVEGFIYKVKDVFKFVYKYIFPLNNLTIEETNMMTLLKNILSSPHTDKILYSKNRAYFSNSINHVKIIIESAEITVVTDNNYYNMLCTGYFSLLLKDEIDKIINENINEIEDELKKKKIELLEKIEVSL